MGGNRSTNILTLLTMNPIDIIYKEIVDILKTSDNTLILDELENSSLGAATGSEGLMNTGGYLLSLKRDNPSVYKLIERPTEAFLKYCKQNGLIIR